MKNIQSPGGGTIGEVFQHPASDGTNSYVWDAEDRLVMINYPGTNNNTQFVYDGIGRNVLLVERTGGLITSTKQMIWSDKKRLETRDASSLVLNRFSVLGQQNIVGGTPSSYFYTRDLIQSVREMTDGNSTVISSLCYEPFGRASDTKGAAISPDFTFTGMYRHSRGNLGLTMFRPYSDTLGRWLSRDPLGENAGNNLFAYVGNATINSLDLLGLDYQRGLPPQEVRLTDTQSEWYKCHRFAVDNRKKNPNLPDSLRGLSKGDAQKAFGKDPSIQPSLKDFGDHLSVKAPNKNGDIVAVVDRKDGIVHSSVVAKTKGGLVVTTVAKEGINEIVYRDPQSMLDYYSQVNAGNDSQLHLEYYRPESPFSFADLK